jgi:hypothetical protein
MIHEVRESPEGVLAIYDIRFYGGKNRPWSVLWTPPGHRAHWPTQSLAQQEVATWAVMHAEHRKPGTVPCGQPDVRCGALGGGARCGGCRERTHATEGTPA